MVPALELEDAGLGFLDTALRTPPNTLKLDPGLAPGPAQQELEVPTVGQKRPRGRPKGIGRKEGGVTVGGARKRGAPYVGGWPSASGR